MSVGSNDYCVISSVPKSNSIDCRAVALFAANLVNEMPMFSHPKMVSVGHDFACALDDTGIQCWGSGKVVTDQPKKEKTVNSKLVSSGGSHACSLNEDGVTCWGVNDDGQTNVPALSNPRTVSAGTKHTCAIDDTGVKCWGSNEDGQSNVPPLSNPRMISAGAKNTCAIDDHGVKCWGANDKGQLNVPKFNRPIAISIGAYNFCGIDKKNTVICWGRNNTDKDILKDTKFDFSDSIEISVGDSGMCVFSDNGKFDGNQYCEHEHY